MATKWWISTSSTSFNTAANWSDGVAPVNGDTLVFDWRGTANVEANLTSTLTTLTVYKEKSYAGQIGLLSGTTGTPLTFETGTVHYEQKTGQGSPSGSALCYFNGNTSMTANVYDSASTSAVDYYPPLLIKSPALTLNQSGGSIGLAVLTGETTTGTFKITRGTPDVEPSLYLGMGVTTTALTASAGLVFSRANNTLTAITLNGSAVLEHYGTGAGTTVTADGESTVYWPASTITTLNLSSTFNRTRNTGAMTFTNVNLYEGYQLLLNNGVSGSHTFTNKPAHVRCGYQDGKIELPPGDFI